MNGVHQIRVLCIVPRGLAGRGGIETLFLHFDEQLRLQADTGLHMEFLASRGDASGAGWVFHFPFALIRYAWLLATRRYDIVHLNAATDASAWRKSLMQQIARLFGVATVVHVHGSAFPKPGVPRRAWVSILARVFERADAIIVLGGFWRDFVAGFYGMPRERFEVIANGVADFAPDAPQPRAEDAPVRLLFAGNLTDAKGANVLLQALALLPASLPQWQATFVGAGDVSRFRDRALQAGISRHVEFAGWVSRDTILPLYRQADIVILPSRNEVLPVSLLEGACAGAALVATPVGSVPDVLIEDGNGLTVKPDDPEGLADALAQLIGDRTRLARFRAASRQIYLSRFRIEDMVEGMRAVYQKALAARR
ncbi:glycosyltransferase family 4 protein [Mesorhizobium sp. ES1-1]|uniref:glycosyltransferase family 4 protein n=1 Tax=Mesorhizobium sp. ES1-1 TaxID=2876629 RepID=UPI001CCBAF78|nr:glycosyltransferase family 4 protein [Mesorhizobium sp. ES1-1]MBZ9674357.1 glycosyltransferase family 4 protein [Mesorhizobium sp. ES1-1]